MLGYLMRTTGVYGLWKGAGVLVVRGAVMSSTQLSSYDLTKKYCTNNLRMSDGPLVQCVASLVASIVLTTCIAPLDVTLTTYQAGPSVGRHYDSAWSCARALVHRGGPSALLRGWVPLWARFLPSSVLTFIIYEQARRLLVGSYLD
jgi:hypothetical protein